MVTAHKIGPATNCRLLNVKHWTTNRQFLVDASAGVSVISRDPNNLTTAPAETPRAVDSTDIRTKGLRFLILDLGLNHTLRWQFILAGVLYSIFEMDFRQHFHLLVDARHRNIVDRQTLLTETCSYAIANRNTSSKLKHQLDSHTTS